MTVAPAAFVIAVWAWSNDDDVVEATATSGLSFPLGIAFIGCAVGLAALPAAILARRWPEAITMAVVAALSARVIWSWWRRRRQGRPSRVLGLVRDLGHKLGVVAVPASDR